MKKLNSFIFLKAPIALYVEFQIFRKHFQHELPWVDKENPWFSVITSHLGQRWHLIRLPRCSAEGNPRFRHLWERPFHIFTLGTSACASARACLQLDSFQAFLFFQCFINNPAQGPKNPLQYIPSLFSSTTRALSCVPLCAPAQSSFATTMGEWMSDWMGGWGGEWMNWGEGI